MVAGSRLSIPSALRSRVLFFALWLVVLSVLVIFRRVLLPFAVALVIAYLLEPLVSRMARVRIGRFHLPRWVAVVSIYAVFFLVIYVFAITAIPKLYAELARLSKEGTRFFNTLTPERISELSQSVEGWLVNRGIQVELSGLEEGDGGAYGLSLNIDHSIREALSEISKVVKTRFFDAIGLLQHLVSGVLAFIFRFFFILMVAAFILSDWARIKRYVTSLVPSGWQQDFVEIVKAIDLKLSGVVRGQAIICVVNGLLTAVGLVILDVPFVFLLSLVATVLSAIPIFGTIISSVPIVLMGLTHGFQTGIGILAWIIGIHALEAYVLNPKIMGAHAHIHPVVVAFALLAGEATFGFTGALFAVPVAGVLLAVFHCAHERALRRDALRSGAELAPAPAPVVEVSGPGAATVAPTEAVPPTTEA